jgi:hypothetical protein
MSKGVRNADGTKYRRTRGGKYFIAADVPLDVVTALDDLADARLSSRAAVMRQALSEWVKAHREELDWSEAA